MPINQQCSKFATKIVHLDFIVLTSDQAAKELQELLGEDAVSMDKDDLESHSYSEASTSNVSTRPVAIIMPKSTEEVSLIAKICTKYKIPMIPFGAGSSVEGHFSAPYSGFSIDMSRMDKIIAIHDEDMDVVVQPGVNWVNLNDTLQSTGLFLPLDPSPTAHIGGMVATNCSGTNAMRYGTMKDWVVNLTVVLADGTVIKTRRRPRKTSAGYNLNGLFTGSEGTVGIITEVTLRLAIVPSHFGVATTAFPSVAAATKAATSMIRGGVALAALELMDDVQMRVINQTGGTAGKMWSEKPTLFIKFSGSTRAVEDSIAAAKAIASAYGGSSFTASLDEVTMTALWSARKQALWAILSVRPEGTQIWSTDVAVPLSNLADIVEQSKEDASKLGLFSTVLGHVGDGNFHQAVMYNPDIPEQVAGVKKCVDTMIDRALEMDGTVSGEHGIGLGKKHCLEKELGSVTIDVMRTLKRSLDPHWLLNPGKILDF
ncbi:D-lactate dehydrogenase [cytochrome], mitochondrial [Penicillium subrubescens]|uniref:D-lactate dehydrogenase (cytochrome) n=1 Tax=Penicillium subrubescens TaxID=1316194 RepID=A0A1Q5UCI4_9EURO|nr:D-lactate dehydrogenase [cytochrome], mitochondrial [Penicillium subrubescens]